MFQVDKESTVLTIFYVNLIQASITLKEGTSTENMPPTELAYGALMIDVGGPVPQKWHGPWLGSLEWYKKAG